MECKNINKISSYQFQVGTKDCWRGKILEAQGTSVMDELVLNLCDPMLWHKPPKFQCKCSGAYKQSQNGVIYSQMLVNVNTVCWGAWIQNYTVRSWPHNILFKSSRWNCFQCSCGMLGFTPGITGRDTENVRRGKLKKR